MNHHNEKLHFAALVRASEYCHEIHKTLQVAYKNAETQADLLPADHDAVLIASKLTHLAYNIATTTDAADLYTPHGYVGGITDIAGYLSGYWHITSVMTDYIPPHQAERDYFEKACAILDAEIKDHLPHS